MSVVVFRCDAGDEDGLGHVKRCITLARAFAGLSCDVRFLVCGSQGQIGAMILDTETDFGTTELPTQVGEKDDVRNVLDVLASLEDTDLLVIDSKRISPSYLKELRQVLPILVIDDDGIAELPADGVLNATMGADAAMYPGGGPLNAQLFGPAYNLVAPQYFELPGADPDGPVLVTMGGEDPQNRTQWLIPILAEQIGERSVEVVVGPAHPDPDSVSETARMHDNVRVTFSPPSLVPFISACRCAVTAGGTTCYELAAARRPAAVVLLEEHQKRIAMPLIQTGAALLADDVETWDEESVRQAVSSLLIPEISAAQVAAQSRLFPSCGVHKVAADVKQMFFPEGDRQ